MLKAVGYGLLIELETVAEKTESGIFLDPKSVEHEARGQCVGTIVDMGSKAYSDLGSKWVKKGDRVFFRRYAGPYIQVKGDKKYMVIKDTDVLGKLTSKDDKIEFIA